MGRRRGVWRRHCRREKRGGQSAGGGGRGEGRGTAGGAAPTGNQTGVRSRAGASTPSTVTGKEQKGMAANRATPKEVTSRKNWQEPTARDGGKKSQPRLGTAAATAAAAKAARLDEERGVTAQRRRERAGRPGGDVGAAGGSLSPPATRPSVPRPPLARARRIGDARSRASLGPNRGLSGWGPSSNFGGWRLCGTLGVGAN